MNYELISDILNSIDKGTLYDVKYKVADKEIDKETLDFLKEIHLVVDENKEIRTDLGYAEDGIEVFDKLEKAQDKIHTLAVGLSLRKYNENYVIDENKSVVWNREEVKKHNQFVEDRKNTLKKLRNLISNSIDRAILGDDFASSYHNYIYNKAYEDKHYAGPDEVYYTYEELLEWCEGLRNIVG